MTRRKGRIDPDPNPDHGLDLDLVPVLVLVLVRKAPVEDERAIMFGVQAAPDLGPVADHRCAPRVAVVVLLGALTVSGGRRSEAKAGAKVGAVAVVEAEAEADRKKKEKGVNR